MEISFKRVFNVYILLIFISVLKMSNGNCYTILIDPGHGGDDEGASTSVWDKGKKRRKTIFEKDLALKISTLIYEKLKKRYSVYMTRSIDRSVSLEERSEMAERVKADLFISIHLNSGYNKRSKGFETYYLNNHDNVAIKKIEDIENKKHFDDDVITNKILTDLVIKKTVIKSKMLASSIHQYIKKRVGKKFNMIDRGVRPGLFYVLALSNRPSVLLEVGFLSNSRESKKMLKPYFQKQYAYAVSQGIEVYIKKNNTKKSLPLF